QSPFSGRPQDRRERARKAPPQRGPALQRSEAMPPRLDHRVSDLAVNVELELRRRRVADANRTGALEAGEPRYLPLRETPLAADAVHDLQLVGAPGDGPEQPVAPVA